MKIGVVGAGTAGLAASLFLARQGHAVDILERVAEPSAVGAGILLQITGQTVLARLGLLQGLLDPPRRPGPLRRGLWPL